MTRCPGGYRTFPETLHKYIRFMGQLYERRCAMHSSGMGRCSLGRIRGDNIMHEPPLHGQWAQACIALPPSAFGEGNGQFNLPLGIV